MNDAKYVRFFETIGIDDVPLVGGKNASLGELFRKLADAGVRVPNGFAITADGYRHTLDQAGAWGQIPGDLVKRPFIVVGMLTLLILLVLAITSTKGWQKRLKANWKRLHRFIYLAAILAVLHFAWKEKVGWKEPRVLAFAGAVALLLLVRLPGSRRHQRRHLGEEGG